MLDFAYYWKEGWLDKSTATGRVANEVSDCAAVLRDVWKCALLAVSVLYIVVFIVTMAVLYHYFGGSDCSEGQAIITVSLVSTLCALVLQLFFTSNGSIIASGIIASYGRCSTCIYIHTYTYIACATHVHNYLPLVILSATPF